MAPGDPIRRGTLLILVAGLAGVLAALALAFAYLIRGDVATSHLMVKQAQVRILLHAAMGVALKQYVTSGVLADLTSRSPMVLEDQATAGTWNGAWIVFRNPQQGVPVPPGPAVFAIEVLVGAGASKGATSTALGSFTSAEELSTVRANEPRSAYRLNFTGALPAEYVVSTITPIAIP